MSIEDADLVRRAVLETLAFEIWFAPPPSGPLWARRAIEALEAAGLVQEGEVEETLERYRVIRDQALNGEL